MTWPTPRRHPRTLADAFPDVRAGWSEGWHRPRSQRWASRLLAVAIGIILALVLVDGLAR